MKKSALLSFLALLFALQLTNSKLVHANDLPRPFAPWMQLSANPLYQHFDKSAASDPLAMGAPEQGPIHATNAPLRPNRPFAATKNTSVKSAPSPLERAYSKRILDEPTQFGYDIFESSQVTPSFSEGGAQSFTLPAGAVQDNFILNIGDRLEITFRGQRQDQEIYAINSQGQIIIGGLPPVTAAGRSIGEIRALLETHAEQLYNTEVYLALNSVRQVNVTVIGAVDKPGRQTLTVFHTLLDALMAAGGVQKDGSLRQIKLVRQGRSSFIDLYGLLIHGSTVMDLSLRDGDRIIIPPIGPTVAIAGSVKRPGIYEILPSVNGLRHQMHEAGQALSLEEMLTLSGGVLNPGQNRFMKLGLTRDGRETVQEIHQSLTLIFDNGSILMVAPSDEMRTGTVELTGHTRQPGLHALDETPNLSDLLASESVFSPDIYPLIGVIDRYNPDQLAREFLAFPPLLVVKGRFDQKLKDGDVVYLFSRTQIINLHRKQETKPVPVMYGSTDALEDDRLADQVLISFLAERSAFVRGAVREPGMFPLAEGADLENLLAVAGGLTLEATTGNIEVTSRMTDSDHTSYNQNTSRISVDLQKTHASTILIGPGDTVRVNQKFRRVTDNSVLLVGEVQQPGRYDLLPGDTLADLLARASGLTPQAYADGAIFSRESERQAEEARFRAKARELEIKLAAALEQKDKPDMSEITAVQELITQLKQTEAVGRITVEADPAMLAVQRELDILLQSGDRIYIPKRPLTVRVAGEVLSPASLQFRKNKDPRDYIMEAGGFTYYADKDRTFVVYPDGSAQPLMVNTWNHNAVFIPPGSTIIVPRDPKPFNFIETAKDVSQILSNLAITGIFIEDIRRD